MNPNPSNCAAATGINRVDAGTGAFQAQTIGFTACGFRLGQDAGFGTEIFSSPAAGPDGKVFFVGIEVIVPSGDFGTTATRGLVAAVRMLQGSAITYVVSAPNPDPLKGLPKGLLFGYSGDNGPATLAQINNPAALAVDNLGRLYIADLYNRRIRRVDPATGVISTYAGGAATFADGVAPTATRLSPTALAFAGNGDLLVADGDLIRKIDSVTGKISTIAGKLDNIGATARLFAPATVAVDSQSNVLVGDLPLFPASYVADVSPLRAIRLRAFDSSGATVSTLAGDFTPIHSGDEGPATGAGISFGDIVAGPSQQIRLIKDTFPSTIRTIDANQQIRLEAGRPDEFLDDSGRTLCGTPFVQHVPCSVQDNVPASQSPVSAIKGVTDAAGNLYICSFNSIRRIDAGTNIITTIAGTGRFENDSGDGGPATQAELVCDGMALNNAGDIIFSQPGRLRRIDAVTGIISGFAGRRRDHGYSGDGGPALAAQFNSTGKLATDVLGNLYVVDDRNSTIRRIDSNSIITTVAGTGTPGFSGDGGPGAAAMLNNPLSVAADGTGRLFIADTGNDRVRVVSSPVSFSLSPTQLHFDGQKLGTTSDAKTVQLTTPAGASVSVALSGPAALDFHPNTSCASTPGGSTCTASVTFTPTATGSRLATLALTQGGVTAFVRLGGLVKDFQIAGGASPLSATVFPGQSANFTLSVQPVAGFTDPISFSCSGLPAGASCSFSPASLTPSGTTSQNVTLVVATGARSSATLPSTDHSALTRLGTGFGLLLPLAGIVLAAGPRRRRTTSLLGLCAIAVTFTACGGGGGSSPSAKGSAGTPSGTYNVTVTAQAGNASHTMPLTLTVQ
jgi:hypothetical protein